MHLDWIFLVSLSRIIHNVRFNSQPAGNCRRGRCHGASRDVVGQETMMRWKLPSLDGAQFWYDPVCTKEHALMDDLQDK